jgi:hypothetical protein
VRTSPRAAARRLALAVLLTAAAGCGSEQPSPPAVRLALPTRAEGRLVTCATCEEPSTTVVIEFTVGVRDPDGPGGTIERLETIVTNRSRASEIGRNVRPNADYTFDDSHVPAGGQVAVQAGIVISLPPPRDEIVVTVLVRLADGREASGTTPLDVLPSAAAIAAEGGQRRDSVVP